MTEPRNAQNWAKPIEVFHIDETIEGVGKGKVEGRKPTAPLHGFGRLWQEVVRGHQKVTSGRPSSHSALMKPRGRPGPVSISWSGRTTRSTKCRSTHRGSRTRSGLICSPSWPRPMGRKHLSRREQPWSTGAANGGSGANVEELRGLDPSASRPSLILRQKRTGPPIGGPVRLLARRPALRAARPSCGSEGTRIPLLPESVQ